MNKQNLDTIKVVEYLTAKIKEHESVKELFYEDQTNAKTDEEAQHAEHMVLIQLTIISILREVLADILLEC